MLQKSIIIDFLLNKHGQIKNLGLQYSLHWNDPVCIYHISVSQRASALYLELISPFSFDLIQN